MIKTSKQKTSICKLLIAAAMACLVSVALVPSAWAAGALTTESGKKPAVSSRGNGLTVELEVDIELDPIGNKTIVKPSSSLLNGDKSKPYIVPGIYDNVSKKFVGYFCVQADGSIKAEDIGKMPLYSVVDINHMKNNPSHSDYSVKYVNYADIEKLGFKKDITRYDPGFTSKEADPHLGKNLHIFVTNDGKLLGGKYLIGTKINTLNVIRLGWNTYNYFGGWHYNGVLAEGTKILEDNNVSGFFNYRKIVYGDDDPFKGEQGSVNCLVLRNDNLKDIVYCNGWQYQDSDWQYIGTWTWQAKNITFSYYKRVSGVAGLDPSQYGDVSNKYRIFQVEGSTISSSSGKWIKDSKGWWYRKADGSYPKSTIAQIDGQKYYFNSVGYMQTGWQKINGSWYYFLGGDSGRMVTGWQSIGGKWYYFKPGDSGRMLTGWIHDGSYWYYLDKDSGVMAYNEWRDGWWLSGNGAWTYQYKASWHKTDNKWWYSDSGGWCAKNTSQWIDGVKYDFDSSGWCTNP